MERINYVTEPAIEGMDWKRAAEALQKHSFECAQKIMELNNELLDLKEQVERLRRGY